MDMRWIGPVISRWHLGGLLALSSSASPAGKAGGQAFAKVPRDADGQAMPRLSGPPQQITLLSSIEMERYPVQDLVLAALHSQPSDLLSCHGAPRAWPL